SLCIPLCLASSDYLSFFCSDPPPAELHPLSLHDALPISVGRQQPERVPTLRPPRVRDLAALEHDVVDRAVGQAAAHCEAALSARSEEHTSELQSLTNLVCRLLLEKKKNPIVRSSARYQVP